MFILAAAVCGFVGLFRSRVFHGGLLLISSLVLGCICTAVALHVVAIAGIYALHDIKEDRAQEAISMSAANVKHPSETIIGTVLVYAGFDTDRRSDWNDS